MLCFRSKKKEGLEAFFADIIDNVSIPYSNAEIRDIQTSVREFINRTMKRINERGIFKISRIEPCGSMEEMTSLWKIRPGDLAPGDFSSVAIEFDFLAVLEKKISELEQTCPICMKVLDPVVNTNRFHELCDWLKFSDDFASDPEIVDMVFRKELCLNISECNCFSVAEHPNIPHSFVFVPTSSKLQGGCDKCSIKMETGELQIFSCVPDESCSLVLSWKSYSQTLFAPDRDDLKRRWLVECLPVYIDFLPAIELLFYNPMGNDALEHRFLVPKRCKQCMIYPRTWRISMCREEVKTMSQMSETHRQSYQILKFLLPSQYSTSYHLKTAVLNHSL